MKLRDGCGGKSGKIVKLNKGVYSPNQAERQRSLRLTQVLAENVEMEQCKADPSVFRLRKDGETIMILCVHVDYIIVGGAPEVCDALYAFLLQGFQTSQENHSWYLGCAFERDKSGDVLRMSQRAFIEYVAVGRVSIQYLGSRHPIRQILVLGGKGNRSMISQFEQRLEV